jgi:hypothetical protein
VLGATQREKDEIKQEASAQPGWLSIFLSRVSVRFHHNPLKKQGDRRTKAFRCQPKILVYFLLNP